jgi:hypothetical protein
MVGDPGPYMNDDGDVWVPRVVPYSKAREVASEAIQDYGYRLVYIGKSDAYLLGFARDCYCDGYCQIAFDEGEERRLGEDEDDPCRVPAWHFRIEER